MTTSTPSQKYEAAARQVESLAIKLEGANAYDFAKVKAAVRRAIIKREQALKAMAEENRRAS